MHKKLMVALVLSLLVAAAGCSKDKPADSMNGTEANTQQDQPNAEGSVNGMDGNIYEDGSFDASGMSGDAGTQGEAGATGTGDAQTGADTQGTDGVQENQVIQGEAGLEDASDWFDDASTGNSNSGGQGGNSGKPASNSGSQNSSTGNQTNNSTNQSGNQTGNSGNKNNTGTGNNNSGSHNNNGGSGNTSVKDMDYESFIHMPAADQQAYMESFPSVEAFFEWYNAAREQYEKDHPSIEIGGNGSVDLDKVLNGKK